MIPKTVQIKCKKTDISAARQLKHYNDVKPQKLNCSKGCVPNLDTMQHQRNAISILKFDPKDGDSTLHSRNVGTHPKYRTASQPRRPYVEHSLREIFRAYKI